MPLYQYSCENKKCEKSEMILEYIVPLAMEGLKIKCPKCHKHLVKLLSAPFFAIR
mgnify:CR=1 FL=1